MACLAWRVSSSQATSTRKHGATSGSSGPPDITCSMSSTASSISRSSIRHRAVTTSASSTSALSSRKSSRRRASCPTPRASNCAPTLRRRCNSRRKGYRQGLRQVLTNLVGNGAKFTAKGSITVRVVGLPGDTVRVEVQDTGVGIAPSDLERIFLPYEQGERLAQGAHGGTGLGLAICAEVVARMGGTIGVESQVGAGSLFWFEVPLPIVTTQRDRRPRLDVRS